jgi:hypothetical protein
MVATDAPSQEEWLVAARVWRMTETLTAFDP